MNYASREVLEFYKQIPFNYSSLSELRMKIRMGNSINKIYPCLSDIVSPNKPVLDVGCGTGVISNLMAYQDKLDVTGIDFNPKAIEQAQMLAKTLGVKTKFICDDLFEYRDDKYPLVISIGVLHHTKSCHFGIRRVFDFVDDGGYFLLGLYNRPMRYPFLSFFREKKEQMNERKLFELYKSMSPQFEDSDDKFINSWFRDQVLHPLESQHTISEIWEIVNLCDAKIVSTDLNSWEDFSSLDDLKNHEEDKSRKARKLIFEQKEITSGFFTVLCKKNV